MEYLTDRDYEIAAQNGIKQKAVYNRFYTYGWSKEKAITYPVGINKFKEWEGKAVVSNTTFYKRLKNGWTPERAALTPGSPGRGKSSLLGEEQFKIAHSNGIARSTVRSRVYRYRWTVEEAITLPVGASFKSSRKK